jgi:hypothetical protein
MSDLTKLTLSMIPFYPTIITTKEFSAMCVAEMVDAKRRAANSGPLTDRLAALGRWLQPRAAGDHKPATTISKLRRKVNALTSTAGMYHTSTIELTEAGIFQAMTTRPLRDVARELAAAFQD